MEDSLRVRDGMVIELEESKVFTSEGHIPLSNYTLNSSSVITRGNVRSTEISVRSTGEVALEDATAADIDVTDTTHGMMMQEDGSTNVLSNGDNLDLEGVTGITY